MVKGIGAVRFRTLLETFGDAKSAWEAPSDALRATGLSTGILENLIKFRADVSLEQIWEHLEKQNIQVLTWKDDDYPKRLHEIDNSPPVIYIRGEIKSRDDWAVAVVGTRRITPYGQQVAERIADRLARSGITVVSGLALGVDAVAHQSTLDAGGRTLAVLGSGVDRIYPARNRKLAARVIENGAIISDYAPGTPPEASNFPPRNRIISGLSLATVIVESGSKGGALITANFALEQGRDVFAVPGNIFAPQSRGPNRLIQRGAHPLLDPKEILEVLDLTRVTEQHEARIVLPSNSTEAQLYKVLGHEPLHVDEIRAQTELPIDQVTAALAMMELKGMVRQVGGMRYTAIREHSDGYMIEEETDAE